MLANRTTLLQKTSNIAITEKVKIGSNFESFKVYVEYLLFRNVLIKFTFSCEKKFRIYFKMLIYTEGVIIINIFQYICFSQLFYKKNNLGKIK